MLLHMPFLASARATKRQRTEGMNSRYDRMIQTVNIMHGSPHRRGSDRNTRNRAVSSSSAVSYDLPRTPAHDIRDGGGLGPGFSTMKMRTSAPSVSGIDMFAPGAFCSPGSSRQPAIERLPPWLEGTISSLDSRHPLRLLAPEVPGTRRDSSPSALDLSSDSLLTPAEDSPFAFIPPAKPTRKASLPAASDMEHYRDASVSPHLFSGSSVLPYKNYQESHGDTRLSTQSSGIRDLKSAGVEPSLHPFSTPGPASTIIMRPNDTPPPLMRSISSDWNAIPMNATLGPGLDASLPFSTTGPLSDLAPPPTATRDTWNSALFRSPSTYLPSRVVQSPYSPSPPRSTAPLWRTVASPPRSYMSDVPLQVLPTASRWISSGDPQIPSAGFQPYATPGPAYAPQASTDLLSPNTPSPSPVHSKPYLGEFNSELLPPFHQQVCAVDFLQANEESTCDTLDFKWERFDRSHADPAGASSSPVRNAPESEETFWSQPARPVCTNTSAGGMHTAHFKLPAPPPSHPGVSNSPALLSPIRSPNENLGSSVRRRNAQQQEASIARLLDRSLPNTPLSQPYEPPDQVHSPSQDHEDGQFAWIVPPRDLPPPSTPRRRALTSPPRSIPNTSLSRPAKPSLAPSLKADAGPAASTRASPHHGGSPFAPAPGVYVSPLRGEDKVEPAASDANAARNKSWIPPASAVLAKIEVLSPPRCASAIAETEPGQQSVESRGEEPATTLEVEDLAGRSPTRSPVEEIEEEDELTGESQASRDTIESWTD
ncbi:hypothetical protein C2E23DRAFT_849705 [Lenzites betulinus]|nr:hypothetical protein C2E23DRAFT_849705 [Lenzites betulinus]